jgi:Flp pilus assembly protein TadG
LIKSQNGQATVELAISLVILIIILFAIIDFGRIFHAYLTLEHASREAARVASVGGTNYEVINIAKESAPSLNSNTITVSISPSREDRVRGTYVTINMSYPISFSIPFFQTILPNPLTINAKTVMRVE